MKLTQPPAAVCSAVFALCVSQSLAQGAAQSPQAAPQAAALQSAAPAAAPPCPLPPNLKLVPANNIFSPEQELELGDIEAERAEHEYHIVDDPQLAAYVNHVAQRIVAQLPPNDLHFQVTIYDSADPNAFSVAGGRIYVSRKLIASMKNEDELAALIGHEMGHTLSHQQAADYSYLFDKVLGVKQVTTREDILQKYNQLLDNAARKREAYETLERHEEPEQFIADRISLYAVANAGYAPTALAEFWDRSAETHGKGSSGLSEILGIGTSSQNRLGEMQRSLAALPPACQRKSGAPDPDFVAWQSAIISYSGGGHKESLAGVLSKKTLNPPLRGDLKSLRFSPDGKYVLAQDDASIYVLSHDPFKEIFRFDAPDAHNAVFSPNSKDVVFLTHSLRVEDWSIASQHRVSAHEIVNESGCNTTAISPDGKHVGCVGNNRTLYVYDVESGNAIFTRKEFVVFSFQDIFAIFLNNMIDEGPIEYARMAFSPDGHYFVASHADEPVGIDLSTGKSIPLHGALHGFDWGGVTFLTNDTLAIGNAHNPVDSVIAKFPSGQKIQKIALVANRLRSSPEGAHIFLTPMQDAEVGALDIKANNFPVVVKSSPALDIFGSEFVLQGTTGQVGLVSLADRQVKQRADLSMGPMGSIAGAISDDFKWLAVSGDTRGAVWNLDAMNRLYFLRGFRGAYFDGDTAMFAHFAEHNDLPAMIGRASLSQAAITQGAAINKDDKIQQHGAYLITRVHTDAKAGDPLLKVRDIRTGHDLWSATFKAPPDLRANDANNRVTLSWSLDSDPAKEAAKADASFAARRSAVHDRALADFVQVRELSTGKVLGSVVVDTGKGSFRVDDWYAAGDWLFAADHSGRTLAYSVSSGELKGTMFGDSAIACPAAGLLIVQPSDGQMQFYALPDLKKLGRAAFSSRIALVRFNADGSRIFVLTRDQNAYVFDSKALANSTTAPPPAATASTAASAPTASVK